MEVMADPEGQQGTEGRRRPPRPPSIQGQPAPAPAGQQARPTARARARAARPFGRAGVADLGQALEAEGPVAAGAQFDVSSPSAALFASETMGQHPVGRQGPPTTLNRGSRARTGHPPPQGGAGGLADQASGRQQGDAAASRSPSDINRRCAKRGRQPCRSAPCSRRRPARSNEHPEGLGKAKSHHSCHTSSSEGREAVRRHSPTWVIQAGVTSKGSFRG